MSRIKVVLIGAIACLCFLTACGGNNGLFAASGGNSSSCKAWEVAFSASFRTGYTQSFFTKSLAEATPLPIEKGWEPFALAGNQEGGLLIRRCMGGS